jgi:hypothetical protein
VYEQNNLLIGNQLLTTIGVYNRKGFPLSLKVATVQPTKENTEDITANFSNLGDLDNAEVKIARTISHLQLDTTPVGC